MEDIMRKEDINLTGPNSIYLYARIGKAKGVNNTIQIYFYFRCPFLLLPLLGILGESKAE